MNVHEELLSAVKDVKILMEALSALVIKGTKYTMKIQLFVLVCFHNIASYCKCFCPSDKK